RGHVAEELAITCPKASHVRASCARHVYHVRMSIESQGLWRTVDKEVAENAAITRPHLHHGIRIPKGDPDTVPVKNHFGRESTDRNRCQNRPIAGAHLKETIATPIRNPKVIVSVAGQSPGIREGTYRTHNGAIAPPHLGQASTSVIRDPNCPAARCHSQRCQTYTCGRLDNASD